MLHIRRPGEFLQTFP